MLEVTDFGGGFDGTRCGREPATTPRRHGGLDIKRNQFCISDPDRDLNFTAGSLGRHFAAHKISTDDPTRRQS